MNDIIEKFQTKGKLEKIDFYGNGDINVTYLCTFKDEEQKYHQYLLQRINHKVFKNVEGLMNNVKLVSEYLHKDCNNDLCVYLIKTIDGQEYYYDEELKKYFRMYNFIENSISYDLGNEVINYEAAKIIGKFQKNLINFDSNLLVETIPYFHDTYKRYEDLQYAIIKDNNYHVRSLKKEIEFVEKRKYFIDDINILLRSKKIPKKTCHNDTKLNNVLFDKNSNKGICMIDFDTIMEGTVLYDFGDAVRNCCNESKENDVEKANFNLNYFESFVKGYLEECKDTLNHYEKENLVKSCIIITLECGMRFLTDYMNGDLYFKINYEKENLDRAKVHFKLVEQMEEKIDAMKNIIQKYL